MKRHKNEWWKVYQAKLRAEDRRIKQYLLPTALNEWTNTQSLEQPSLLKTVPTKTSSTIVDFRMR